jgi:hypothetical protein
MVTVAGHWKGEGRKVVELSPLLIAAGKWRVGNTNIASVDEAQ